MKQKKVINKKGMKNKEKKFLKEEPKVWEQTYRELKYLHIKL